MGVIRNLLSSIFGEAKDTYGIQCGHGRVACILCAFNSWVRIVDILGVSGISRRHLKPVMQMLCK
jgi:hypothetical protein